MHHESDSPEFDLFVAYAPADREWVEGYLLDALYSAGVRAISEGDFSPGAPRIEEFERAARQSKNTVLVLTPAALGETLTQFVAVLVQQFGLESGTWPVVPLILKKVVLPPRLAMLVALDATDPAFWPEVVARLCSNLQTSPPTSPTRPHCPYPGMRTFREQEASHFYGREAEVDSLLQRLRHHPLAAVIGASGSGKSSLIFAGLLPALRRSHLFGEGEWLVRSLRPGTQPLAALREALGTDQLADFTPIDLLQTRPNATRLLVVVDQAEEIFTQGSAEASLFFVALRRLVALRGTYWLITLRADFFTDLLKSDLWPLVQAHRFEITPLDARSLREAIVKPAEAVGVFIESTLVERLVDGNAGQPGLLPFVQELMVRLWDKLERRYLPLSAYEALVLPLTGYSGSEQSGIQAALAQLADELIRTLDSDSHRNQNKQRIARQIFLRLVQFGEGRDPTRRQQPKSALCAASVDPSLFEETLDYLAQNRLVVVSAEAGGEPRVDLAHEAMLAGWPLLPRLDQNFCGCRESAPLAGNARCRVGRQPA